MKRLLPFRAITAISLLVSIYSPSLNALCCRSFVSDVICSVLASEQSINNQLISIESLTDQVIANLPDIFSDIEELNVLDIAILNNLNSILPILIQDTIQSASLLQTSTLMLSESSYILSVNESISNTTNNTTSIAEQLIPELTTIINENNLIISFLEDISKELSILDGNVLTITGCPPIPIFSTTTISVPGSYCLANDMTGFITINSSNVTLNLNGHTLTGLLNPSDSAIQINTNLSNVEITNGKIINGVNVDTGVGILENCSAINLSYLELFNFLNVGIQFGGNVLLEINKFDSFITQCRAQGCKVGVELLETSNIIIQGGDYSENTNGVIVQNSQKITINNASASANTNAGFSLVSTTNSVINGCKAFGNGSGSNSNSYGFISTNGSGNIFENCIADGTTITSTAYNLNLAGFALAGTENCSKILGCESANAFAPYQLAPAVGGVLGTVAVGPIPYGILLQSSLSLNNNSTPISNPATPVTVASLAPSSVTSFSVSGNTYIAVTNQGSNTVSIINVSNPASPTTVGSTTTGTSPSAVTSFTVSGNTYIAVTNKGSNTVSIINVTNPVLPTTVGSTTTGTSPSAVTSFTVSGNTYIAVTNQGSNTVSIINVSTPASPTTVGSTSTGTSPSSVTSFMVSGNTYIAVTNQGDNTFSIINVSTPASPTLASTTSSEGLSPSSVIPYILGISNNIAVTCGNSYAGYVTIFDVSDPSIPNYEGFESTQGTSPSAVTVFGNGPFFAITNQGSNTVAIFMAQFEDNPTFLGSTSTGMSPSSVTSFTVSGNNYIAVTNQGDSTVSIINVSNAYFPSTSATLNLINPNAVAWSPNGQYLALVNYTADNISLITVNNPLSPVVIASSITGSVPYAVAWSPNGQYLAVANYGSNNVSLYDVTNPYSPINIATPTVEITNPYALAWSPNGQYIAVANNGSNSVSVIYVSTPSSPTVANIEISTAPYSVSWSPNGQYLAVGGVAAFYVLSFINPASPAVVYTNTGGGFLFNPVSLSWSPNGEFLAVLNIIGGAQQFFLYNITNPYAPFLLNSFNSGINLASTTVAVAWSPNSRYVFIDGNLINTGVSSGVLFDISYPPIPTQVVTNLNTGGSNSQFNSATWSPDGQYIAVANSSNTFASIYSTLQFPSNNIIKDNIVWCNNGGDSAQPNGVGISGSNIANLIVNNTSYCNNSANYQFVTTPAIFNTNFDWIPTQLQNISVACGAPIPATFNLQQQVDFINAELGKFNLINNQIQEINTVPFSAIDTTVNAVNNDISIIDSQLVILASQTDFVRANFLSIPYQCASLSITASTTISSAGIYCLANDISGSISINSSNVTLDLNNHTITNNAGNALNVAGNNNRISIANGRVIAPNNDGLKINSGDEQITIRHITAQNSIRGINVSNATNVIIDQCDFVSNTTGLEISTTSTAIIVTNCTAVSNIQAGFSLINSSKNYIGDSKALGNGFSSSTNGFGFVSNNGSGNIFERNIAENTLTGTTAWLTAAAGFALLGTENCSRIVDSTSSNNGVPSITATVSHTFTGTTGSPFTTNQTLVESGVPYGILLGSTLQITNSMLTTYTGANPGAGNSNDIVNAISWSPDNRFMVVGGLYPESGTKDLALYAFDPSNTITLNPIEFIATGTGNVNDQVLALHWSPNGKYIAVGTKHVSNTVDLQVYSYDICSPSAPLTLLTSVSTNTTTSNECYAVRWSPNNQYLAVGGSFTGVTSPLKIYSFSTISTSTVTPIAVLTDLGVTTTDIVSTSTIYSIDWSPNGNFIAVGGATSGTGPTDRVHVYSFNAAATPILTRVTSVDPGTGSASESAKAVRWSPDGNYIAVGANVVPVTVSSTIVSHNLAVYAFQSSALTLIGASYCGTGSTTDAVNHVSWSGNEQYLAVGGMFNQDFRVFSFNPQSNNALAQVTSNNPGNNNAVNAVNWSPDGSTIAVGGQLIPGSSTDLLLYSALSFPQNNLIQNNTMFCNTNGSSTFPAGVGISGSGVLNLIINNMSYSNPFSFIFVVNTFSQLFESIPSPLENPAIAANTALLNPDNIGLNILAIENTTVIMTSQIAALITKMI